MISLDEAVEKAKEYLIQRGLISTIGEIKLWEGLLKEVAGHAVYEITLKTVDKCTLLLQVEADSKVITGYTYVERPALDEFGERMVSAGLKHREEELTDRLNVVTVPPTQKAVVEGEKIWLIADSGPEWYGPYPKVLAKYWDRRTAEANQKQYEIEGFRCHIEEKSSKNTLKSG